jgi:hypothetical protein
MGRRSWLGWGLIGLSAGLISIAISEWDDDRGGAITWVLLSVVVAVRGILTLRSSGESDGR